MVGPIPPLPPPGAQIARPAAVIDPNVASAGARRRAAAAAERSGARLDLGDRHDGRYRIRGLAEGQGHRARASRRASPRRARSEVAIGAGEVVDRRRHRAHRGHVPRRQGHRSARRARGRRRGLGRSPRSARRSRLHRRRRRVQARSGRRHRSSCARPRTATSRSRRTLELPPPSGSDRRPSTARTSCSRSPTRSLAGTVDDDSRRTDRRRAPRGASAAPARAATRSSPPTARSRSTCCRAATCACASSIPTYPTDELDAVASATGERVRLRRRRSAAPSKARCSTARAARRSRA